VSAIGVITGVSTAGGAVTCFGRVYGNAGTAITQASLSSITYKVNRIAADHDRTETETADGTVTISSSVFDSLQTSDPRWTKDSTGYNFRVVIPASAFLVGDLRHRIDFLFTPVSGEAFAQSFSTVPIRTEV